MLYSAFFCMATAVYWEARNQTDEGMLAIPFVIHTRALDPRYPNYICDVVKEGGTRRNTCQFSFYCDGKSDAIPESEAKNKAIAATVLFLSGIVPDPTEGATHYHAVYVDPWWVPYLNYIKRIDSHLFYWE